MPGDLLDLILLVLIAAFAIAGYRQGFIIGVLSLAGFVAGAAGGAYFAPGLARALARSTPWQAFVAILLVFMAAVIGMLIASGIGVAVRSRLTARPVTVVDSLGGAVVNVLAVLVVAWLIGSLVASAPYPAIAGQVRNSVVLKTVDDFMPPEVLYLPTFPELHSLLSNGLYQQVFSGIDGGTDPDLAQPTAAVLRSKALARVEPSIVKIQGDAPSCRLQIEGSGFVISPDHVLTNAHVVAGVTVGPTVTTTSGLTYAARVVYYDPNRDLAVLYVPGLPEAPLQFAPKQPADDASAIVAGYPLDHGLTVGSATVGLAQQADGPNIYDDQTVDRQIYPIRAIVQPGNSGGPLLAPDGDVYGVVFAAATTVKDLGYALTAREVAGDAAAGSGDYTAVSTQACQGG